MSEGGIAGSQAQIRMAGGGIGEGSYWVMQEEVPYQILRHYNDQCVSLCRVVARHMFAFVGPDGYARKRL